MKTSACSDSSVVGGPELHAARLAGNPGSFGQCTYLGRRKIVKTGIIRGMKGSFISPDCLG